MLDRMDVQRIQRLNAPHAAPQNTDWLDVVSNNYGFFAKHDYPYRARSSSEFLLGVFGGSVAQWFCLQQGRSFAQELAANLGKNRTVEVLNFGLGAFKQPQSAFALAYFVMLGQRFDAVLLLDGFNEAALAWVNATRGTAGASPSASHMDMFDDVPCLFELEEHAHSVSEQVHELASLWAEGARLMHQTCRARGIPFFHVLQPNQYHSRKAFSAAELNIAISRTSAYGDGVRAIYPELVSRMRRFDWNAFDATDVFDGCPEIVYSDNCCHYNRLGNSILGQFILTRMVANGLTGGPDGRREAGVSGRTVSGQIGRWFATRKARRQTPSRGVGDAPDQKDDLYPMW